VSRVGTRCSVPTAAKLQVQLPLSLSISPPHKRPRAIVLFPAFEYLSTRPTKGAYKCFRSKQATERAAPSRRKMAGLAVAASAATVASFQFQPSLSASRFAPVSARLPRPLFVSPSDAVRLTCSTKRLGRLAGRWRAGARLVRGSAAPCIDGSGR